MRMKYTASDPPGYLPLYDKADSNQSWAAGMSLALATLSSGRISVSDSIPTPDPIPSKEDDVPMETLYHVFVVSKARKIVLHDYVVAKDQAGAQFRAGVDGKLRQASLEPDDVTIICQAIGAVEVERKPQTMKIVKE